MWHSVLDSDWESTFISEMQYIIASIPSYSLQYAKEAPMNSLTIPDIEQNHDIPADHFRKQDIYLSLQILEWPDNALENKLKID